MPKGHHSYIFSYLPGLSDSLEAYVMRTDTVKKQIVISQRRDSANKNTLAYHYPDKEHLVLRGSWKKDSIYVKMKIYDLNYFLLVNRKFRWVSAYPFNR